MSTPRIPKGWRKLKVGSKRPRGYRFWLWGEWHDGKPSLVGEHIRPQDDAQGTEPYITRIRSPRKLAKARK